MLSARPSNTWTPVSANGGEECEDMLESLDYLRQLNVPSLLLRMTLAMFCGGMIGIERGRKHRAAGFRTYMLVCLGAALTMILSQYVDWMGTHVWTEQAETIGFRTDVSRLGAQVINGIGFLGAGIIIVTGHQEVKGLTTAAGLWASACMGLAIGAGFYECVLVGFCLIFLAVKVLPALERKIVANSRNLTFYMESGSTDDLQEVVGCIRSYEGEIYSIEPEISRQNRKNAAFSIVVHLPKRYTHMRLLSALSALDCVRFIQED